MTVNHGKEESHREREEKTEIGEKISFHSSIFKTREERKFVNTEKIGDF